MTTECSILVLDDDPVVLHVMELILERGGYRIVPVSSVALAEKTLASRGGAFHLLIADVGALPPDGDGESLLRRWQDAAPGMQILLASGGRGETMTLPGYPFLPKPFGARELLGAVRGLLDASVCRTGPANAPRT